MYRSFTSAAVWFIIKFHKHKVERFDQQRADEATHILIDECTKRANQEGFSLIPSAVVREVGNEFCGGDTSWQG